MGFPVRRFRLVVKQVAQAELFHSIPLISLACWRLLSDRLAIARCLHNLANVVKVRDDYPRARWALGEAAGIFQDLGDSSGAAWSINQQGDIARATGDIDAARAFYRRALAAFREAGDPWGSARSLTDLGYIDLEQANHSSGGAAFREAMGNLRGIGPSARDSSDAGGLRLSGSC